jgi:hypothetical protein
MKSFISPVSGIVCCIFSLMSCQNSISDKEIKLKEKEIELLKKELALNEKKEELNKSNSSDTISNDPIAYPINSIDTTLIQKPIDNQNSTSKFQDLSGEHNLTIQWIGWDIPGKINFELMGGNTYSVEGKQYGSPSNCNDCYLTISGIITVIDPKTLRFSGKITSSIGYIQNGIPCIKKGTFDFISTKNRKYWRCQNMKGCDGVVDYVDIYF